MPQVLSLGNLKLAFWKASKGLRERAGVREFHADLEANLLSIQDAIRAGDFPVGRSTRFVIRDPKERVIHAPAFPERVFHHALMNVCEPVLERVAISDSYACRKGKGQLAAVRRAEQFALGNRFFLKLDIRKYFDSIDHDLLEGMLARVIKDQDVLVWFGRIIGSYQTAPGRGIPMGSLASQHFANFFLHPLDHWVKECLECRAYVRYMDDSVLSHHDVSVLRRWRDAIREFLRAKLRLELKAEPCINRSDLGMDFLGFRVRPGYSVLNRRSRKRYARKLKTANDRLENGTWREMEYQQRVQALTAFTQLTASTGFRRHVLSRFGVFAQGLEPREPRRELEQLRQELPGGQPEQEQAREPEQQPGLPARPQSDSVIETKGTGQGGIPSAVVGTAANPESPPGAGRPAGGRIESSGRGESLYTIIQTQR